MKIRKKRMILNSARNTLALLLASEKYEVRYIFNDTIEINYDKKIRQRCIIKIAIVKNNLEMIIKPGVLPTIGLTRKLIMNEKTRMINSSSYDMDYIFKTLRKLKKIKG